MYPIRFDGVAIDCRLGNCLLFIVHILKYSPLVCGASHMPISIRELSCAPQAVDELVGTDSQDLKAC